MNQYRDRRKAFIGAVVGAGLGVAKGIAGIVSKKKQAEKQQQQDYVNAVLQSKGGMDDEINNNEALQEQFESKYVMKCGGRKRACYGKASKMACGGRKKAELGALTPLQAHKIDVSPTNNIDSLNKDLQSQIGNIGKMNSSSTVASPLPTGGQAQSNFSTIGDVSNTAGKIEAGLSGVMNLAGSIGNMTGKFKCGGRKKGLAGLSMGMQAGNMVGEIGKAFVKGPQKTEVAQTSIRKQGLTNLNQPGTNNVQMPTNNIVTANTNSAAPIPTQPLAGGADSYMKRCGGKQAKFGTSRRRCGLGVSISINSKAKK